MKVLSVLMASLLLVAITVAPLRAMADGSDGGAPMVLVDAGTPTDVPPADAGTVDPPPPVPLVKGQPAPDDGWFFTAVRAQQMLDNYSKCQQSTSTGNTTLLVAVVLGAFGGMALGYKVFHK